MQYFNISICRELEKRGLNTNESSHYVGKHTPYICVCNESYSHHSLGPKAYSLFDLFNRENAIKLWDNAVYCRCCTEKESNCTCCEYECKSLQSADKYKSHHLLTLYQSEGFEAVERYLKVYLKI